MVCAVDVSVWRYEVQKDHRFKRSSSIKLCCSRISMTPRPFLKWAGGKTQLLNELLPLLPQEIDTYYEPFLGGGAVFFAISREKRIARRVILSDSNPELINAYVAVRDDVKKLLSLLRAHARSHCERHYYEVRDSNPRSVYQRAARTIYLNKTGFNGLYRVNRNGQFNVPFGRYTNPKIVDEENLLAVSVALEGAELVCQDFGMSVASAAAHPDDASVYFDPPYLPVKSGSFTSYDRLPFGTEEHQRLADGFRLLADLKARVVLTNSSCEETYRLYRGIGQMKEVASKRSINSDGCARGAVQDVIVFSETP